MSLTAAVCTRHRPATLSRALASLRAQSEPPDEILVVDNGPRAGRGPGAGDSDAPDLDAPDLDAPDFEAPDSEAARGRARWVREPVEGLDFARNRALREGRGEVVAFLDDDAVAHVDWAAGFRRVFTNEPDVLICTGRVEALATETKAQRLFEANGGFGRGLEPIRLPEGASAPLHGRRAPLIAWAVSVGSGCSFAVRRPAALAVGGFDEALDLGAALPGGGDLDMMWRLLASGGRLAYAPEVLAWHEHRRELADLERQLAGHQRALSAFLVKTVRSSAGRARLSAATFLAWRLAKQPLRVVRSLAGRDPLPARILVRMWWSSWSGLLAYRTARRIARVRSRGREEMITR